MKKNFISLLEANPNLAKEWHPTKNGNLTPANVAAFSNKNVWWCLQYDVPDDYSVEHLRGKHFNFEWQTTVSNRNRGSGCPYLSGSTWSVYKGFNDLATVNPELAKEWHPTKNENLTPDMVPAGSGKKVWWYLPYDVPDDYPIEYLRGKHFDFEWQAIISNRNNGNGCPYLFGQAIWVGFNDLATVNPELAKEWHPTRNGNLTPANVAANSGEKAWWYLPYDVPNDYPVEHLRGRHFDFEWEARISSRNDRNGCPFLSGQAIWVGFNDLATINPELAAQWHPTKNGSLKPTDVTAGNGKKVWWYLPYDVPDDYPVEHLRGRHFDFEWEARISDRSQDAGCPYLFGKAVLKGFNDLETVSPELASEWHPTKNGKLKPSDVTPNCMKNVWWYLSYDVPEDYPIEHLRGKHFDFEWHATISSRNKGIGCPFLSGRAIWKGFNDLATVNQKLTNEWHPTKNGNLKPTDVTANSNKKVWWYLSYDIPNNYMVKHLRGKHFNFEWQAIISNRNNGNGCPYLFGQAIWVGFNDLATVNPELAKEWHPTKNGNLTPANVAAGSRQKVWWLYKYTEPKTGKVHNYEWQATISHRNQGIGCPYLSESHGEKHIKKYFSNNNFLYNYEKTFDDLKGIGGKLLSYDFHIINTKVLIEYQGIQHYKPKDFFGGESRYYIQVEHDKRKKEYAKSHGYKLIEVSYKYDTYEKIATYLDKKLKPLLNKYNLNTK